MGTKRTIAAATAVWALLAAGAHSAEWDYRERIDPIDNEPSRIACVTSENTVRNALGELRGLLCFHDSPREGFRATIALDGPGARITCSHHNGLANYMPYMSAASPCNLDTRFDAGEGGTFAARSAPDGSGHYVEILRDRTFMRRVRAAAVTHVAVEVHQAGPQTLTFTTAGLPWPER